MIKFIAPDGTEYEAATPTEANDLRFGHGYRLAEDDTSKTARADRAEASHPPKSPVKPDSGDGG